MAEVIRILGIDPGSTVTGWGVIDREGARLVFVAAGAIRSPRKASPAERLAHIHRKLKDVVEAHGPVEAAVEETFVNASPRDAIVLGQARGVALLTPALFQIAVAEYAANTVKKAVVGRGHADKKQVQAMIRVLMPASGEQPADAADALAVAVCHAHHLAAPNIRAAIG